MGQTSAYFVPHDQERFFGRGREVVEAFWHTGTFLTVNNDHFIHERVREWKVAEKQLPVKGYDIGFGGMGLIDLPSPSIVPHMVYDLCCPGCGADVTEAAYDKTWSYTAMTELRSGDMSSMFVECMACGLRFVSTEIQSKNTRFTWAHFYIWVSDIDIEHWDPKLKETVESILGPCEEYQSWET